MFNFFIIHHSKKDTKKWRYDFYLSCLKILAVSVMIIQRQKYDLKTVTEKI